MAAYNPGDWSRDNMVGGLMVGYPRISVLGDPRRMGDMTGMEGVLPSPPPPYPNPATASYMPQHNGVHHHVSPLGSSFGLPLEHAPIVMRSAYSPLSQLQEQTLSTSSNTSFTVDTPRVAQQTSPTYFPPPPTMNARDRSTSRVRGAFTNLSAWTNRSKGPDNGASPLIANTSFTRSPNEDDPLRHVSTVPSLLQQVTTDTPISVAPPAARRAISAGYAGHSLLSSRDASRTRYHVQECAPWEPGMPLPPPPPGPPLYLRSQSLGPPQHSASMHPAQIQPSTPPRQPTTGTALGSVPPTPADWVDDDDRRPQHANTVGITEGVSPVAMLRFDQRRQPSSKGIRERRSESRARSRDVEREAEPNTDDWGRGLDNAAPPNLVLTANNNLIGRRRHAAKASPSPKLLKLGIPMGQCNKLEPDVEKIQSPSIYDDTSDFLSLTRPGRVNRMMPTPPFSPESPSGAGIGGNTEEPLARFFRSSLDRYRVLMDLERKAVNDSERLGLFTQFMVTESSKWRARFVESFEENADELLGSTRTMWQTSFSGQRIIPEAAAIDCNVGGSASVSGTNNYGYEPTLSPVLSAAASNLPDDSDSRGRPPSRWWESSTFSGSIGAGGGSRRLERTTQESKYMGISLGEKSPYDGQSQVSPPGHVDDAPTLQQMDNIKTREVSYFTKDEALTPTPRPIHKTSPTILTPRPGKLEISRLITLPPPFPRHYPAQTKCHPQLEAERIGLQRISDTKFLQALRESINSNADLPGWKLAGLGSHLRSLIAEASACLASLEHGARESNMHNPGRILEAGDEEVELLERLTLMKWIFDGRELLLREQNLLEGACYNEASSGTITPGTDELVLSSPTTRSHQSRRRHEDFQCTVHSLSAHSVQDQSCAFWDIAPPLAELVHTIFTWSDFNSLSSVIEIPNHEYVENPAYIDHPLQYLYSLLLHARQSTRQFIEGQINLFCLEHEVAYAVVTARKRASDGAETTSAAEGDAQLTRHLQVRVAVVEEQWEEALGAIMGKCMMRVESFLRDTGGWNDLVEIGS